MFTFSVSSILIFTFLSVGTVVLSFLTWHLGRYSEHFSSSKGKKFLLLLKLITGIASFFYLVMTLSWLSGSFPVSVIHNLRYFDWLVTTPLIMYMVGFVANQGFRHWTQLTIVLLDIFMILSGVADSLFLFVAGNVVFVAMLAILLYWARQVKKRETQATGDLYLRLMRVIIVSWILYPIVAGLGNQQAALLNIETEIGLYMILDVFAKGFFVFLIAQDTLSAQELGFMNK